MNKKTNTNNWMNKNADYLDGQIIVDPVEKATAEDIKRMRQQLNNLVNPMKRKNEKPFTSGSKQPKPKEIVMPKAQLSLDESLFESTGEQKKKCALCGAKVYEEDLNESKYGKICKQCKKDLGKEDFTQSKGSEILHEKDDDLLGGGDENDFSIPDAPNHKGRLSADSDLTTTAPKKSKSKKSVPSEPVELTVDDVVDEPEEYIADEPEDSMSQEISTKTGGGSPLKSTIDYILDNQDKLISFAHSIIDLIQEINDAKLVRQYAMNNSTVADDVQPQKPELKPAEEPAQKQTETKSKTTKSKKSTAEKKESFNEDFEGWEDYESLIGNLDNLISGAESMKDILDAYIEEQGESGTELDEPDELDMPDEYGEYDDFDIPDEYDEEESDYFSDDDFDGMEYDDIDFDDDFGLNLDDEDDDFGV